MDDVEARVLVVDDIPSDVDLLSDTLSREGYDVIVATSGEAALALFQRELPDLAILDDALTDLSGVTVCQRVKSDPVTRHIPIIMMTEKDDVETRVRALEAGADDFLAKPTNWVDLRVRARMLIRMRQMHDMLQRSTAELVQVQHLREDLVDTIIHDFKSPLSTVIGALELLLETVGEELGQYSRQLILTALQASLRQNAFIEDMLDVIRMEAGEMPVALRPAPVAALVEQCVAEMMPMIEQRNLTLKTEIAPDLQQALADSGLLRRVIANLLENAIRSTPEGGSIAIVATMSDGQIQLGVLDTGHPVPPELHDIIFDRHRCDEVRAKGARAGAGVGLAFCWLAIRAMHGRIWVESARNVGGAFYFSLPADGNG
jgi:two-component system sensor histidine kinase/response regulator